MEEIFEEYVTFHVTASDGSDVEMAVAVSYTHLSNPELLSDDPR